MSQISKNSSDNLDSNLGISKTLLNELFNPSLDLSMDYSEIYIDDLIENETLKEIPIVKTVVGVIRGGISINQFWFAKKLLTFIQEFNTGKVDPEKLNSFREKINNDKSFGKKVAERLMVFIDRNIEITQTKITSNLFAAYVNDDIEYEELCNILIALDKLSPKAFVGFFELEKIDFLITEKNSDTVGERNWELETLITSTGLGVEIASWFHGFKLTSEGAKFFEFGLKPLRQ